jgi:hypothetical protein
MKVVSLDQCFLRTLLWPPTNDTAFSVLKTELERAVDAKKIVCPGHAREMIYESVLLDPPRRDAIIAFQNRLARSFLFRDFYERIALDTLKLIRPGFDYLPFHFGEVTLKPGADLNRLASDIRSSKQAGVAKSDAMPYPPKDHIPGSKLPTIYQAVLAERCGSMYRVASALLETGKLMTGKDEWDAAVGVGEFLQESCATQWELRDLRQKIIDRIWEKIPVLCNHTLLFSQIEQEMVDSRRKFSMNDHPDVLRLCIALDLADVAGCDGEMKELLKKTKLLNGHCMAFSIREPEAFRQFLSGL